MDYVDEGVGLDPLRCRWEGRRRCVRGPGQRRRNRYGIPPRFSPPQGNTRLLCDDDDDVLREGAVEGLEDAAAGGGGAESGSDALLRLERRGTRFRNGEISWNWRGALSASLPRSGLPSASAAKRASRGSRSVLRRAARWG